MDLDGSVVLVTGASGLIGRGIARQFAGAGARVVAHYHRGEVEELADSVAVRADLSDEAACHRLVREAFGWLGRLDAVVNNAGVQPVQDLAGMTAADWRAVVDTNVLSAFACTQAAAEVMRDSGGSVTHIASIEGTQPAWGHAHYNASKAALIMHARSAALEYGRFGIRVNTVSPGLIDRPGLGDAWPEGVRRWEASAPLKRLGTAEDVGNACVFLASPLATWITGHDLVVDGGVSVHPTW
ncbi:NAD(P)-dependent dehydrogenase (short-subunit alcohol dehydrogenase family) [Kibdelosporangium banguiense]|uniref:NAD(P)-dependent dehydrogenase (Short-subunit alcohol dehydrogenase family) n=1 Tax=Kibdelosporangium banguiense TaxID=1365924 RepID=A0ABS4TJ30_9PSEU|nr:SDR family oxidoreductase [Kibdelosporangium banguiense]MBP2324424.1 NAD(P)-dependent dehydrogenase (short-subunit alcohol dehydrogenase family) [Kibdelosporangium banguiense]